MKKAVVGNPPTGGGGTSFSMQYQFDALGAAGLLCGTNFNTYTPYHDAPQELGGDCIANAVLAAAIAFSCALVGGATNPLFAAALGTATAASQVKFGKQKGSICFKLPMETVISAVVGASSQTAPSPSVGLQAAGKAIVNHAASSFVRPSVVPDLTYGSSNGVAIIPEAAVPLGARSSAGGQKQTMETNIPIHELLKEYGIMLIPTILTSMWMGIGNNVDAKFDTKTGLLTINGVSAPVENVSGNYSMTPDVFNELMKKAGVDKLKSGEELSPEGLQLLIEYEVGPYNPNSKIVQYDKDRNIIAIKNHRVGDGGTTIGFGIFVGDNSPDTNLVSLLEEHGIDYHDTEQWVPYETIVSIYNNVSDKYTNVVRNFASRNQIELKQHEFDALFIMAYNKPSLLKENGTIETLIKGNSPQDKWLDAIMAAYKIGTTDSNYETYKGGWERRTRNVIQLYFDGDYTYLDR